MPMVTDALTVDVWYEVTDLDDETFVFLQTDSADPCVLAFGVAEPPATSEIGILLSEGINAIHIPAGKAAWLKLLSGTMSVTYSQFDGILMDVANCGFAYSAAVPGDTDWIPDTDVSAGKDYATVRDSDNPYDFIGWLQTEPCNIADSVTIDSATLSLSLSQFLPGEVIRIHASFDSDVGTFTDYSDLDTAPLSTAYSDLTVGWTGLETVDVTSIMQEMVDTMGWSTSSPLQLILEAYSAATEGIDSRITIVRQTRLTNLVVVYS